MGTCAAPGTGPACGLCSTAPSAGRAPPPGSLSCPRPSPLFPPLPPLDGVQRGSAVPTQVLVGCERVHGCLSRSTAAGAGEGLWAHTLGDAVGRGGEGQTEVWIDHPEAHGSRLWAQVRWGGQGLAWRHRAGQAGAGLGRVMESTPATQSCSPARLQGTGVSPTPPAPRALSPSRGGTSHGLCLLPATPSSVTTGSASRDLIPASLPSPVSPVTCPPSVVTCPPDGPAHLCCSGWTPSEPLPPTSCSPVTTNTEQ